MLFSSLFLFALTTTSIHAIPTKPVPRTTGRMIIRLKSEINLKQFEQEFSEAMEGCANCQSNSNVVHWYREAAGAFNGYAGVFSKKLLGYLEKDSRVESITPDYIGHIEAVSPWNIKRLFQKNRSDFASVSAFESGLNAAGEGITAYILDTGIDSQHKEFTGRVVMGPNFIEDEENVDKVGHGTHIAGILAGKQFGLAKAAKIVSVKVCDQNGDCSISDVIAGIQYVIKHAKPLKSVINISMGVEASNELDEWVESAKKAGIPVVVSAGNTSIDSCLNSPRRSKAAFVVAATDEQDKMASFSNYGKCVKIFAPGVNIMSAAPGGESIEDSGTSMASPHVAGLMALMLGEKTYSSVDEIYSDVIAKATKNIVGDINFEDTVNALAHSTLRPIRPTRRTK